MFKENYAKNIRNKEFYLKKLVSLIKFKEYYENILLNSIHSSGHGRSVSLSMSEFYHVPSSYFKKKNK